MKSKHESMLVSAKDMDKRIGMLHNDCITKKVCETCPCMVVPFYNFRFKHMWYCNKGNNTYKEQPERKFLRWMSLEGQLEEIKKRNDFDRACEEIWDGDEIQDFCTRRLEHLIATQKKIPLTFWESFLSVFSFRRKDD